MGPDAVGARRLRDRPAQELVRDPRQGARALGERLEELLVGVYLNGAGYAADPGTRLLIGRLLTSDAPAARLAARDVRQSHRRRPARPDDDRAGRRRARQADHRSRLARRAMTMRRTTLAVILAVAVGARRPGGGLGAHRLRRHVADERLPRDRQGPDLQLRRLEHAPAADRARRARRRVRVRQPDRGPGAVPGGPLHAPGDVRDQPARAAGPATRTRATSRSVYSLRSGGRRLAIGNAGVPIGAYTRQLLARMRLSCDPQLATRVSQQTNVGPGRLQGRARLGRRRLRLLHRRPARSRDRDEDDQPAQVGAAAGPLPDLRRAPAGADTARRAGLHQAGDAARPAAAR